MLDNKDKRAKKNDTISAKHGTQIAEVIGPDGSGRGWLGVLPIVRGDLWCRLLGLGRGIGGATALSTGGLAEPAARQPLLIAL